MVDYLWKAFGRLFLFCFVSIIIVTWIYLLKDNLQIFSLPNPMDLELGHRSLRIPNTAPMLQAFPDECKESILWGLDHQGGWYICKDFLPTSGSECIVYSYGLGADWSFDNAAEAYGCNVHGFDPTGPLWQDGMYGKDYTNINYHKQYPSKLKHFHNWGIGAADKVVYPPGTVPQDWPGLGEPPFSRSNQEPWEMKSIEQTIKELNHLDSGLSILKIDVEGAEWDSLAAFLGSKPMQQYLLQGKIKQLLLEFHWDPESKMKNKRHYEILVKLSKLGFIPWKVNRHEGSDCCLDMSYIWKKPAQ